MTTPRAIVQISPVHADFLSVRISITTKDRDLCVEITPAEFANMLMTAAKTYAPLIRDSSILKGRKIP